MIGASIHGNNGNFDKQIIIRMLCGSVPASVLTLIWLSVTRTSQSP
jgi:hypothetical protein